MGGCDVVAPGPGRMCRAVDAWGPGDTDKQESALAHPLIQEPGSTRGSPGLSPEPGSPLCWGSSLEEGRGEPPTQPHAAQGRLVPAGGVGTAPSAAASCLQSSHLSWAEARDPHMYRPIVIALLMRFLQQLTGITPILVYLQSIFDSTAVLLVRARPHTTRSAPRSGEGIPAEHLLCAGVWGARTRADTSVS